jgi:hypothetical protein
MAVGLIGVTMYLLSGDVRPKGGMTLKEKVHILKMFEGRAP